MVVFQVVIVEWGGEAFKTEKISPAQWAICIVLGLLSLPFGVIIRMIPDELFSGVKDWVNNTRANDGRLPAFDAYSGKQEIGRANSFPASITSNRTNSISSGSNVTPGRDGLVNLSNSSPRNSMTGSRRGTGQSMVRPATPLTTSTPASDAVHTTSS
ncbi:hypothetical protein BGZ95_001780 [Linnemannia exigua]|uniref:Uncharacterized protein n=1 Tax=Linnemannia exigua TaxID=604196 RepID=A0AAD4H3H6_9FUNG|nr:hypothetical protein BGZ95_001780 [Linnemannia exigua]